LIKIKNGGKNPPGCYRARQARAEARWNTRQGCSLVAPYKPFAKAAAGRTPWGNSAAFMGGRAPLNPKGAPAARDFSKASL